MAPPSAADGLDRAYRPAVVGYQGFDVEERLKLPQILVPLFSMPSKKCGFRSAFTQGKASPGRRPVGIELGPYPVSLRRVLGHRL